MRRPPRSFTPEEDAKILALDAAGVACREIARRLDRERTSMERRLYVLRSGQHPNRNRVCRCGQHVFNEPWTDFRFCEDCRLRMHTSAIPAGTFAAAAPASRAVPDI
jgi:hypothetical protein